LPIACSFLEIQLLNPENHLFRITISLHTIRTVYIIIQAGFFVNDRFVPQVKANILKSKIGNKNYPEQKTVIPAANRTWLDKIPFHETPAIACN